MSAEECETNEPDEADDKSHAITEKRRNHFSRSEDRTNGVDHSEDSTIPHAQEHDKAEN